MKTTVYSLLIIIFLVISHAAIFNNSQTIALGYAIPYVPMSNEEAYEKAYSMRSESDKELDRILQRVTVSPILIAAQKDWHYQRYVSTYVEPTQNKINVIAGILFAAGYIILTFLVARVFYRWMQDEGRKIIFGSIKTLGYLPAKLLSNMGLDNLLKKHRLRLAEVEFLRLKSLFDNQLITEDEFLAKKVEIERTIRNGNLLNK